MRALILAIALPLAACTTTQASTPAVTALATVGQQYGAKTTPHMYVVAPSGELAYAGAFSNAPMGRIDGDVEVNYVAAALTDLAGDRPVTTATAKPWGCSVKY